MNYSTNLHKNLALHWIVGDLALGVYKGGWSLFDFRTSEALLSHSFLSTDILQGQIYMPSENIAHFIIGAQFCTLDLRKPNAIEKVHAGTTKFLIGGIESAIVMRSSSGLQADLGYLKEQLVVTRVAESMALSFGNLVWISDKKINYVNLLNA